MKKILLIAGLLSLTLVSKAQTVLNEVYVEPGGTHSEFIELYNSSTSNIPQNLDCFTVVTYYEIGSAKGFYVLDLPNLSVGPKAFFVLAAASPFSTQSTTNSIADVNWNNAALLAANNGSLTQYQLNAAGTGYTNLGIPANLQDFMVKVQIGGPNYYTMLFQNGAMINGFIGGGSSGTLPAAISGLPDLPVVGASACTTFNIHWAGVGAMEFVNSSPGNDNGFARTSDGKCGAWVKTSSSVNHTPGVTNGGAAGLAGSLTTVENINCGGSPRFVLYDITAISGSVTLADDFPVNVQVYADIDHSHTLTGADVLIRAKDVADVVSPSDTIQMT